jgi:hypothetical protein
VPRPIDWSAPVCQTPTLLKMIPGLTASTLAGRRANGHARRHEGRGPASYWLGEEIVEAAFCISLQRLGFTTAEAYSCWITAGLPFLALYSAVPPSSRVDSVSLALWRRPDRSIAMAPLAAPDADLDPNIVPEIAAAQAAGLPVITMEISALVQSLDRAIRHHVPGCAALAGDPASTVH